MVSIAKGNIPGAIFNASISGLLGIIITPMWIGLFMSSSAAEFDFWDSILRLVIKILLPVALGLFLNHKFGLTPVNTVNILPYSIKALSCQLCTIVLANPFLLTFLNPLT